MKTKLLELWNRLRATIGLPAMIVILLAGSYFVYITARDWHTRHELERQQDRIEQYSKQSQAAIDETNRHLADFEVNRQATVDLLDTIKEMSTNIKQLAENDRVINIRVDSLKNDYENSRNQKRSNSGNSNIPLRAREDNALSTDRELYPD